METLVRNSYDEVGGVPGTYRIIDLYCLKEVLNQIMRCSCNSNKGFALYQGRQESKNMSFHSVLDIICNNCERKICFGTTILCKQLEARSQPDIDSRLDNVLGGSEIKKDLWNDFYKYPLNENVENKVLLHSSRTTTEEGIDSLPIPLSLSQTTEHKNMNLQTSTRLPLQLKYQCEICSKLFKKQYNLQQHTRIHTSDYLYCHYSNCGKKFNDKSTLNKHVKSIHLKETPYPCDKCDKKFKTRDNLKQHYVVHTGERKFVCQHCDKRFSFQSSLHKHLIIHSPQQPVKCHYCLKEFKTNSSCKKHVKKFHPLHVLAAKATLIETG